jgi:hypothetical protein
MLTRGYRSMGRSVGRPKSPASAPAVSDVLVLNEGRETMTASGTALQFTVTLQGITPKIWRRIQVPSGYSFWDLHVAIQDAMGWTDSHLHLFNVKNPSTGKMDQIGIPSDDDSLFDSQCLAGWEVRIASYFTKKGAGATYEYDFGDDWQHSIVLDAIVESLKVRKRPLCIDGARACPPEDCGGVHGYQEMVRILKDSSDPGYGDMLEWVSSDYDPDHFDPEEVRFDSPKERLKSVLE